MGVTGHGGLANVRQLKQEIICQVLEQQIFFSPWIYWYMRNVSNPVGFLPTAPFQIRSQQGWLSAWNPENGSYPHWYQLRGKCQAQS